VGSFRQDNPCPQPPSFLSPLFQSFATLNHLYDSLWYVFDDH
jgi:hypothetical protein